MKSFLPNNIAAMIYHHIITGDITSKPSKKSALCVYHLKSIRKINRISELLRSHFYFLIPGFFPNPHFCCVSFTITFPWNKGRESKDFFLPLLFSLSYSFFPPPQPLALPNPHLSILIYFRREITSVIVANKIWWFSLKPIWLWPCCWWNPIKRGPPSFFAASKWQITIERTTKRSLLLYNMNNICSKQT